MTTHELAKLLEHLQLAFGENLKSAASGNLTEAAAAFREAPDQNLRAFLTSVRRANAPQPTTPNRTASIPVSSVLERIRAIRAGNAPAGEVVDLSGLTNPQLKEILREFRQPVTGTKTELLARIRQLCVRVAGSVNPAPNGNATVTPEPANAPDPVAVEAGVTLYQQLTDNRQLSIPDVRSGFAPLRDYPKPVLEEISRRVGYTPAGSREDIINRLLNNLEGIKLSQHRADRILTGTSG